MGGAQTMGKADQGHGREDQGGVGGEKAEAVDAGEERERKEMEGSHGAPSLSGRGGGEGKISPKRQANGRDGGTLGGRCGLTRRRASVIGRRPSNRTAAGPITSPKLLCNALPHSTRWRMPAFQAQCAAALVRLVARERVGIRIGPSAPHRPRGEMNWPTSRIVPRNRLLNAEAAASGTNRRGRARRRIAATMIAWPPCNPPPTLTDQEGVSALTPMCDPSRRSLILADAAVMG